MWFLLDDSILLDYTVLNSCIISFSYIQIENLFYSAF